MMLHHRTACLWLRTKLKNENTCSENSPLSWSAMRAIWHRTCENIIMEMTSTSEGLLISTTSAVTTAFIKAGANVVMLNLSPQSLRNKYGSHDFAETTQGLNS